MPFYFDPAPFVHEFALRVNQERGAHNAAAFAAVHHFVFYDIKTVAKRLVFVADQLDGQGLARAESFMGFQAVARDADDIGMKRVEPIFCCREVLGFRSAARGIVLRIKIQNHPAALAGAQVKSSQCGGSGKGQ